MNNNQNSEQTNLRSIMQQQELNFHLLVQQNILLHKLLETARQNNIYGKNEQIQDKNYKINSEKLESVGDIVNNILLEYKQLDNLKPEDTGKDLFYEQIQKYSENQSLKRQIEFQMQSKALLFKKHCDIIEQQTKSKDAAPTFDFSTYNDNIFYYDLLKHQSKKYVSNDIQRELKQSFIKLSKTTKTSQQQLNKTGVEGIFFKRLEGFCIPRQRSDEQYIQMIRGGLFGGQ